MGLTTGDGLAVLSVCATIIVAIIRFVPGRFSSNGNGTYQNLHVCNERHRGLDGLMTKVDKRLEALEKGVNRLLSHAGLIE